MKSLTFLISLSFIIAVQAQPKISSVPFNEITSVVNIDNERLLITQYKGDYKALIYKIASDSVIHRFIPEGKGPGEATAIITASYNKREDLFTFFTSDQKWIQADITGQVIRESISDIPAINHITESLIDDYFLVFPKISIPQDVIKSDKKLPAMLKMSRGNLESIDTLFIRPSDLGIQKIEGVNKVNYFSLNFTGSQIDSTRFLLTHEGSRFLYLFKSGDLIHKEPVEIAGNFGVRTSERNGRVGIQTAAFFTQVQELENRTLLFSCGNTHQEVPFGATYVQVTDSNNIILHHENLYDTFHEMEGGYNHIISGTKRIWFSNFYFTGFSIFIEDLQDK